ncbi:MAG: DNA sulfur modification protein DndB [Pseudomonadota bacterium]
MTSTTLLPAIRSRVGDWNYYTTSLTLHDVAFLVKDPDEIHERKQLSSWIQREAIDSHSEAIALYILQTPQRFLGALIIGIYDGSPEWAPLEVNFKINALNATEDQQERIAGKLGLLKLSGNEKLFAIDGQHRVAGIKAALAGLESEDAINSDEITAIFVGHDASTAEGRLRTRRLFTTVNKKAKRVSLASTIALDEDNGIAIVTRQLIDRHWIFEDARRHILYTSNGSVPPAEEHAMTSVVGLYEIVRELYGSDGRKDFESARPADEDLEAMTEYCIEYFDEMVKAIPEYKKMFRDKSARAREFRTDAVNHLLFRPIGQKVFARAVSLLYTRDVPMKAAISILKKVDLSLFNPIWSHLLWDPVGATMITSKAVLAETQLLVQAGQAPRTKASLAKLRALLKTS